MKNSFYRSPSPWAYCQINDGFDRRLGVWIGAVDITSVGGPAPRALPRGAATIAEPLARARAHPEAVEEEFSPICTFPDLRRREGFDAVKPLMGASVRFKGQLWFHVNFWARCRKSKKIKRFFAEVHYKPPGSSSVCSGLPFPVPGAENPPSSSSVCSYLPFPVPEAEKPSSSSSVCLGLPFSVLIPIVEACTIIQPLGKYRSCAFCRGHLDILHPMGRKFVCGNDKDRIEQRLLPCGSISPEMPFTCRMGPASPNSREEEED
ncbi:uncharacterized protein LOC101758371 isoform X2 [Setaria italica]|uniref:uncharacterized protein LOC101758371 isoform X2 n=1 Tax=Setaria italica TaxID=4555 RepID=UPI000BE55176|nr:uncharacterized protein LOC101758371 isoform X2 [Setaria italica]